MGTDKKRIKALAKRINSSSNADFVKRLLDAKRKTLKNTDGTVSTHELGYVTDGDSAVVFPSVQSVGDSLVRFQYPESYERAVENGDTVHMSVPDAEMFTKLYKQVYPGFERYSSGGKIHINPKNRGKFNETKRRTGKTTEELTHSKNPLTRKRAIFAQNAAKWNKHAEGGLLHVYDDGTPGDYMWYNPQFDSTPSAGLLAYAESALAASKKGKEKPKKKTQQEKYNDELAKAIIATGNGAPRNEFLGTPQEQPLKEEHPLAAAMIGGATGNLVGQVGLRGIGEGLAKGIEWAGEKAMPSALLKGAATYLPETAGFVNTVAPWADAAALAHWSTMGFNAASDAARNGDTLGAVTYGGLAALPIAMPLGMSLRSAKNPFRLSKDVAALDDSFANEINVGMNGNSVPGSDSFAGIAEPDLSIFNNRALEMMASRGNAEAATELAMRTAPEPIQIAPVQRSIRGRISNADYQDMRREYIRRYQDLYDSAVRESGENSFPANRARRALDFAGERFDARFTPPFDDGTRLSYFGGDDYMRSLSDEDLHEIMPIFFRNGNTSYTRGLNPRDLDYVQSTDFYDAVDSEIRRRARAPFERYLAEDLSGFSDPELVQAFEQMDRREGPFSNYNWLDMVSGVDGSSAPHLNDLEERFAAEAFRRLSNGDDHSRVPDNILNRLAYSLSNNGFNDAARAELNARRSWRIPSSSHSVSSATSIEPTAEQLENRLSRARNEGYLNDFLDAIERHAKKHTGNAVSLDNAYRTRWDGALSEHESELGQALNDYFAGTGIRYKGEIPDFSNVSSIDDVFKINKFLRENDIVKPDADLPLDVTSLSWFSSDPTTVARTADSMLGLIPSGGSLSIGSLSGDSIPIPFKEALRNYGLAPGQVTIVPTGRTHSINRLQNNRITGIDTNTGKFIFEQPGVIRRFSDFDVNSISFTPEELSRIANDDITPEISAKFEAAMRAIDESTAEKINRPLREINALNTELGLPLIDLVVPPTTHNYTPSLDFMYVSGYQRPGFRAIKHKYGGTLNSFAPGGMLLNYQESNNSTPATDYANKWDRISNSRYTMANDSLMRSGSDKVEADRLARFLAAQSALEAGWVDEANGNNYAGYMSNGKRMSFDNADAFWDYHIKNLDERWPGWRKAKTIDEYFNIINNTALGLTTKELFKEYNKKHLNDPAYIYAPDWENENYFDKLKSIYDKHISKYVKPIFDVGGMMKRYGSDKIRAAVLKMHK